MWERDSVLFLLYFTTRVFWLPPSLLYFVYLLNHVDCNFNIYCWYFSFLNMQAYCDSILLLIKIYYFAGKLACMCVCFPFCIEVPSCILCSFFWVCISFKAVIPVLDSKYGSLSNNLPKSMTISGLLCYYKTKWEVFIKHCIWIISKSVTHVELLFIILLLTNIIVVCTLIESKVSESRPRFNIISVPCAELLFTNYNGCVVFSPTLLAW